MAQRKRMLQQRFAEMDMNRQESIKRITESIWEKEESLKNDIDKER